MPNNIVTTFGAGQGANLITEEGVLPVQFAPASSPSVAAQATFVFRPGGVASGNVFTSWSALMAAIGAVAGVKSIVVDSSLATATVPAGTVWNIDECSFSPQSGSGVGGAGQSTLHFAQGSQVTFTWLRISGSILFLNDSTVPPVQHTGNSPGAQLYMNDGAFIQSSVNGAWFRESGNNLSIIIMSNFSSLGDTVNPVITVDAGKTLILDLSAGSSGYNTNALAGGGTILLNMPSDAVASTPAGTIATLTISLLSKAVQTAYTPAVLANWSGTAPTSVANALDRIAAKITPIP